MNIAGTLSIRSGASLTGSAAGGVGTLQLAGGMITTGPTLSFGSGRCEFNSGQLNGPRTWTCGVITGPTSSLTLTIATGYVCVLDEINRRQSPTRLSVCLSS